jgi:hypothetical protein
MVQNAINGVLADESAPATIGQVNTLFFTRTMTAVTTNALAKGGVPVYTPMERIFNALGGSSSAQ